MRLDYVTIFPDFFAPLALSLPGKAAAKGLVAFGVHDLRSFTHDRHRTVDDTPYGGGAGMVMKPEPWGEAFDALLPADTHADADAGRPTVVFTTPSGEPFDQALAAELATREHLVFACGRYEGIDQRVIDHARERAEVREISLGDYVLNGGEVAALAITEAVVRLLPGFMGNAESLVEESHSAETGGLLEYPVYTKPPTWRGREVPEVLRSGDHGKVARWRHEQAVRRTAERRPDLLAPSVLDDGTPIVRAVPADAAELLVLQRACWVQEALANDSLDIPALHESLDDVRAWLTEWDTWVVRRAGRLVAAVRGRLEGEDTWDIGRIMVAPDLQGSGLGRVLLEHIQQVAPASVTSYVLFTGAGSVRNQRMYRKAGFRLRPDLPAPAGAVVLTKTVHRPDTRRTNL
ncbi:tRNA (guanosine(37)-N1)-methyltransferase TrmD [Nocardioides sp. zg-ZUI104]|nr:tRNA (guanosine(37)-N1)-methyltransferase TrmD [Nocardioides faecalis]